MRSQRRKIRKDFDGGGLYLLVKKERHENFARRSIDLPESSAYSRSESILSGSWKQAANGATMREVDRVRTGSRYGKKLKKRL